MTKSIVARLSLIVMVTSCAGKNEPAPSANPPAFKPINTGREFKSENFPNVSNSVYGAWDADTAEFGQDMAYFLSLYVNKDEVGMKRTCLGSGESVEAATVVDGKVTSSKIKINGAAYVLQKGGAIVNCDLTVNTGVFSYKRSGNQLEVTFGPGEMRSFTRAK